MLQVVAGLTVAFVGYVLYEVFKTVSSESNRQASSKRPPAPAIAAEPAPATPAPAPKKPAPEPAQTEVEARKSDAVADEPKGALVIKDPVSGETGPAPTNYRFAKKWIKEALVAEGLLDKIYKAADLDEAGARKVKEALEKFKGMKKYHG